MQKKGPCTISEAKEVLENIVRAYLVKNEEGNYIIPEKDRIPAMLIGPPGIGKTDIAGQVAREQNMGFEKGILFLDEFNCMSETIAPTMLSLLQQKRIGNYSLPEGWLIVLAGNH